MTAEQRRASIIRLIKEKERIKVSELSRSFGVSEVTVRSDLELLETEGKLTRTHGGAVGQEKLFVDMDLSERYNANSLQKRLLAQKVAELVDDNDTLMLNAGTTLMYVLRAIRHKRNISIVTNSIANATEAVSYPGFNVILLGGLVEGKYQFTYGGDAVAQLGKYHATKCILSVDGVHETNGLTLFYANESEIIRKMIDASDNVIIAADSTKLGKCAFSRISAVSAADIIVTNRTENRNLVKNLTELGTRVLEA